ncbi:unnamed protein product [Rangifer tarandus platyrhynchus]|uniref:Uncharacterized protein n=1 Tax=Rangifer tarandus platyrhynchus TaxID=3082113 RepID=A0AC59ZQJ2_RANTA
MARPGPREDPAAALGTSWDWTLAAEFRSSETLKRDSSGTPPSSLRVLAHLAAAASDSITPTLPCGWQPLHPNTPTTNINSRLGASAPPCLWVASNTQGSESSSSPMLTASSPTPRTHPPASHQP